MSKVAGLPAVFNNIYIVYINFQLCRRIMRAKLWFLCLCYTSVKSHAPQHLWLFEQARRMQSNIPSAIIIQQQMFFYIINII